MKTLTLILLLLSSILLAQTLNIGTNIATLNIKDQFGEKLATQKSKTLIFAFSKAKGKEVKEFLDKNTNYLKKHHASYIADISSAPSFVASMFMIPKFEKYPFKMGLIRDEKLSKILPKKENMLTILSLKNSKVTKIKFQQMLP